MAKSAAPWTPNPAIAAQIRARPSRQAQPSASRQAQAVRFRQAASFVAPSTYSAFGRMQVPGSEDARVYPFGRQAILCSTAWDFPLTTRVLCQLKQRGSTRSGNHATGPSSLCVWFQVCLHMQLDAFLLLEQTGRQDMNRQTEEQTPTTH